MSEEEILDLDEGEYLIEYGTCLGCDRNIERKSWVRDGVIYTDRWATVTDYGVDGTCTWDDDRDPSSIPHEPKASPAEIRAAIASIQRTNEALEAQT